MIDRIERIITPLLVAGLLQYVITEKELNPYYQYLICLGIVGWILSRTNRLIIRVERLENTLLRAMIYRNDDSR